MHESQCVQFSQLLEATDKCSRQLSHFDRNQQGMPDIVIKDWDKKKKGGGGGGVIRP